MVEYVITTPDFRAGQAAAWKDYERDPDSVPNLEILEDHCTAEFALGYLDEWNTFIVPAQNRRED